MLQKDPIISYLCDPALDPLDFLLDFFPPLLSDGGGGGLVAKNTFSALRSLCSSLNNWQDFFDKIKKKRFNVDTKETFSYTSI